MRHKELIKQFKMKIIIINYWKIILHHPNLMNSKCKDLKCK